MTTIEEVSRSGLRSEHVRVLVEIEQGEYVASHVSWRVHDFVFKHALVERPLNEISLRLSGRGCQLLALLRDRAAWSMKIDGWVAEAMASRAERRKK